MAILEAVGRLVPGVMSNEQSALDESFSAGLLEYPQYTKPAEFRGMAVPAVLRSGDHARIEAWRRAMGIRHTMEHRPDLIEARGGLTPDEQALLDEFDESDQ
jgi:tRNA (guanine37-N1)-methyltransferase